jgi:ABC-type lipoprotein export system ATPase subunit
MLEALGVAHRGGARVSELSGGEQQIVVTHDEKIIPTFERLYRIRDGRTEEEAGEGRPIE